MAVQVSTNVATLSVASRAAVAERALAAFRGEAQGVQISFASVELLWQVLTRKRWQLLQALTGAGAVSIREAARRVDRDVKAVHGDVTALLDAGLLQRENRGVIFPYDGVHVDFVLGMAA
jgi:predicted transcriptional regulator